MAEYIVTASNGKRYRVEGPAGAPEELVKQNLDRQLAQREFLSRPRAEAPTAAPERSTMLEEVKRSARGLASGARTGIEALLGDPEQAALEGIQRGTNISEDYGVAPSFAGLKDVYENEGILAAIGEGASQVPRFIAQQAPVLAQLAAAGKIGASLPLPPQLRPIAGAITAAGSFIPSFTGSNLERRAEEQMDANQVVDVDVGGAALTATGQAATEALGGAAVLGKRIVSSLLGNVPKDVAEAELKKLASRGTLASIAAAGARGAAVEMPTEVIQQMLERNYAGLPLADDEAMREYGEAAYAAGLSGGAVSGVLGSRDGARARRELEQREPTETQPATQTPAEVMDDAAPRPVPGAEFAENLTPTQAMPPARGDSSGVERIAAEDMPDPFAGEGDVQNRGETSRPGLMPANAFIRSTAAEDTEVEGARPVSADTTNIDVEPAPAQGEFAQRAFSQMPEMSPFRGGQTKITREYVNSLGIKYPAHKWVNDNLVGKTAGEVRQMVEKNPSLLTTKGTRADLLQAIIASPPAAAVPSAMAPFTPVQADDVVVSERDAQADPFAEGVEAAVDTAPGVAAPTPDPFATGVEVSERTAPGVAEQSADPFVRGLPATAATAPGVVSDPRVTQGVEVTPTTPGVAAQPATPISEAPPAGDVQGEAPLQSAAKQTKETSNITSEINRSFERALRETQTSQELLGRIANDKLVPAPLRAIARALRSAAPNVNVPVELVEMEGDNVVGEYTPSWRGTERIALDPRASSVPQTYLHEYIHALTVRAIAEDTPAGVRVKALFEQFKKNNPDVLDPETGEMKPFTYGLTNAYEFVSEGLTNANFQALLKQKNLWQRFVDAIRQLVGLQPTQNTILDELLDLTKEMAVGADARFIAKRNELADAVADAVNPAGNVKFLRLQGETLRDASVTENDPKFKRAVSTFMGSGGTAVRSILAWGLPLPALNDYVQTNLKKKGSAYEPLADSIDRFTKIAHRMEGELEQFTVGITAQMARMGQWRNDNPTKLKILADVYFGGRLAQVDILKPRVYYEGIKDEAELSEGGKEFRQNRLKEYDRLRKLFVQLEPAGQQVLRQMRVIHDRQFKQLAQQVYDRVYSETQDREMATSIRNEFTKQMREKGPMEGYAAFQRPNGKYLLRYPVEGSTEPAFEIFTNELDRRMRINQLKDDGVREMDIQAFLGNDLRNFDGIVPTSFMGKLVQELKDNKATPELIESIMALGVSMSPSSLVLQRLAKSRNVPGYINDAVQAFQEGTAGLGKRLVNLKYGAQLSSEIRNMEETRKNVGNDPLALDIVKEMTKRGQYAMNPSHAGWSNTVTTATYAWTLGLNLSSAVVDLSSLPLVTLPFLAKFPGFNYGMAKTSRKLLSSSRDIMGMGYSASVESLTTAGLEGQELQDVLDKLQQPADSRDMIERKAMPSMLNIDFTDPAQKQRYGNLEVLVKKMQQYGHSERYSELSESVEFGESNRLSKWTARMGIMMSASERFKREVGLKAAYELELERLAPNGNPTQLQMEAAADKAMEMSTLLNGGSTAVTGAGFQRGDYSRIFMMYRRFAAGQLYLQVKSFITAFRDADPKTREEMRSYLMYSMVTSAAFVGVKGMPLMGAATFATWALSPILFGDDEDEDNSLESMIRRSTNPLVAEGMINALTNTNVAGRMELSNLLIRDVTLRDNATVAEYAFNYLGGPAAGSAERIWRGVNMFADGDMQRGIETMAPTTLANILKSFRLAVEGEANTLRGDEVVPVTAGGALAQALGFAPADYARAVEMNIKQSRIDRRMGGRRTSLMEAVYVAQSVGDTEGLARAMQKIIEFNQQYPKFSIDNSDIRQSMATRERNSENMILGSLPAARRREERQAEAEAWGFE